MATIKDIVKKTGLGIGTVSRALNGGTNVKPETLHIVLEAAKAIGYSPNRAARMLAKGDYESRTVGLAMPFVVHPFFFEVLKGVQKAFHPKKINMLLFDLGQDPQVVYDHILSENLAGILIVATEPPEFVISRLSGTRTPFLLLDYHSEIIPSFYVDNFRGGELAANYLIERGRKRIAYIGNKFHNQQQDERFAGFERALNKKGLELIERIDIPVDSIAARQASLELIHDSGADGIFYFCDELAYGGVQARLEIGSEVSVIGFDDLNASKFLNLSTIHQPAYEMGFECANCLAKHMSDYDGYKRCFKSFEPVLIDRGS